MTFDGQSSHAAAVAATKKTDWQVYLSQWVGMLAIVALGALAFEMQEVSTAIREHDKHSEMMMRITATSNRVAEKSMNLLEERLQEARRRDQSGTDHSDPADAAGSRSPHSILNSQ